MVWVVVEVYQALEEFSLEQVRENACSGRVQLYRVEFKHLKKILRKGKIYKNITTGITEQVVYSLKGTQQDKACYKEQFLVVITRCPVV